MNNDDFPSFEDKKPFLNTLFVNDSLTTCDGFVNGIREYVKNDKVMYFFSVGLIIGSVQNETGDYKGEIINCDLLAGATLQKWSAAFANNAEILKGVRFTLEIRNLKFIPKIHDNKSFMDSKGILETIKVGKLSL